MRIQRFIIQCPFIACCIAFLSCSQTNPTNEILFGKIEKQMTVALTHEENSPVCTFRFSIDEACDTTETACLINEEIKKTLFDNRYAQSLHEAIDSFCNTCARSYKERWQPLYKADCKQSIKSTWYDHHYDVTSTYECGANQCLCYRITDVRYEGGITEIKNIHLLNFNIKTGKRLVLNDIFQPTYPTIVHPLLLKELQKKFKCTSLNDLNDKGILLLTDIYIPENYKVEKNGITFLYNADEIASYSIGAIELYISSEELKSIIKQEYKYLWN